MCTRRSLRIYKICVQESQNLHHKTCLQCTQYMCARHVDKTHVAQETTPLNDKTCWQDICSQEATTLNDKTCWQETCSQETTHVSQETTPQNDKTCWQDMCSQETTPLNDKTCWQDMCSQETTPHNDKTCWQDTVAQDMLTRDEKGVSCHHFRVYCHHFSSLGGVDLGLYSLAMVSCRGLLSHRCLVDMSCEQVLCAKRRVCSQDMSTREGGLLLTSLVNTVGLPMLSLVIANTSPSSHKPVDFGRAMSMHAL